MDDAFGPLRKTRVAENLAFEIKQKILRGALKAGDKLPSERELAKQCSTSRITVREAFRLLERDGLLCIKQGVEGGAFITETDYKMVEHSLSLFLQYSYLPVSKLTETRFIVEPEVAKLAAQKRSNQNLIELEGITNRCQHGLDINQPEPDAHLQFHFLLAKASQNPLLIAISNSLIRFLGEKLEKSNLEETSGDYLKDQEFHREIFFAVKDGNTQKAFNIMKAHIEVFNDIVNKKHRHSR